MADKDKGLDFLESPEGLERGLGKAQDFFTKNNKLFMYVGAGLLVAIALVLGYRYYQDTQNEAASEAAFAAFNEFEADSLNRALKGGPGFQGLTAIADEYSSTKAGKLASFYAGVALLKQGKYDQAIERLEGFNSDDLLVQARAYALLGDAYLEKKDAESAIDYYEKAANYRPNKFFTPAYLMKLAVAQEEAKQPEDALESYTKIVDTYPLSTEVVTAKKMKAKLEASLGK